ncbi:hypothetical protein [Rhodococcus sp. T7]|uniref:hypothetical protein n=1 Tax=Rhodococcus sp. T7 TaxID=627444 RepID=UPI001358452A|nr:hypothetical protein [Rhodococcus sp. T7]
MVDVLGMMCVELGTILEGAGWLAVRLMTVSEQLPLGSCQAAVYFPSSVKHVGILSPLAIPPRLLLDGGDPNSRGGGSHPAVA